MATDLKRQESKRRLAAVAFLSSISLDGTNCDNKYSCVIGISSREKNVKVSSENQYIIQESSLNQSSSHASRALPSDILTKDIKDLFEKESPAYFEPRTRNTFGSCRRNRSSYNPSLSNGDGSTSHLRTGSFNRRSLQDLVFSNNQHPASFHKPQVKFLESPKDYIFENERIVFVSKKRIPIAVFSALPYCRKISYGVNRDNKQDLLNKRRHVQGTRQLSTINDGPEPSDLFALMGYEKPTDGREMSYQDLLVPSLKPCLKNGKSHEHVAVGRCISYDTAIASTKPLSGHYLLHQLTAPSSLNDDTNCCDKHPYHNYYHPSTLKYHPNILDDPELIAGKHSTLLDFQSYLTSIINYFKPSDLKKELNEKFKERFPCIQLTLSKMRSLKRDMCKIARQDPNIDYLTVAQAYVYFEKLILKLLINKQNRKLCAGACLILSAKLNDVKGNDMKSLIERTECTFKLNRKDLISTEFSILVALEFSLHLPSSEILSHYQRLLYET